MELSRKIARKVEHSFDSQAMMKTCAATLQSVQHGTVVIEAPILSAMTQQHGFGHAALTFGLGDSAAGYAALSIMPDEAEVLTSEMKIHLLAPAKGDLLRATGTVIKPGRRLVIVQAEVHAIQGSQTTQIALLTGTMVPVIPK